MLVFVLTLGLGILSIVVAVWATNNGNEIIEGIGMLLAVFGIIGTVAAMIMLPMIIVANVGTVGKIAANQQRYDSLVYQLENNLYDNDNDLGKKELYDEIQNWNEDLAKGQVMQHDIWVGWFYPNIYDGFEFIELGS